MTSSMPDSEPCGADEYCAWEARWESDDGDPNNPNGYVSTLAVAICADVK